MCRTLGIGSAELVSLVPISVFTCGEAGCRIHWGGSEEHITAIPVRMKDPTGAGDSFRAGFLLAYQRGYPPDTCARVGTVTSSFVVEGVGCQTNLPSWEEMRARYERHFGALMPSVS